MMCFCNNLTVFRLGSRIELGVKLIKMCVSIVFLLVFFVFVFCSKY